jgi:ABC-2 type transport system ATP-binding protein
MSILGEDGDCKQMIQVPVDQIADVTARLLAELPVQDLTIEDPPIESVIERAFHD